MRQIGPLALLLVTSACSMKPRPDPASSSSASTSPTTSAAVAVASSASSAVASDDARHVHLTTAYYAKDLLVSCLEFEAMYKTEADAKAKVERSKESIAKDPKGTVLMPDACAKTFSDRVALGTCVHDLPADNKIESGTVTEMHYIVEALRDDGAMRDCVTKKGKWTAIPRTSSEYEEANAQAELRKNAAEMKQLQKQMPH